MTSSKRARPVQRKIDRWTTIRIYIVGGAITAVLLGLGYKAYGLQVENSEHYLDLSHKQHLAIFEVPAPRGAIHDNVGRDLAVTANIDSVFANPRKVVDVAGTAETLSSLLGVDVRLIEERLASRRHFAWIKRHIDGTTARRIREADLPGISLTPEPRRFYPGGNLAGPILGFAGIDGNGLEGLELSMEELLIGQRAKRAALRDAAGRIMLSDGGDEPVPGATITLTLDRFVQFAAERALREAVSTHLAKAGSIVVLDVKTGRVMAMANWPTFDPNKPGERKDARNRAITDAYEIGSVMKVFTIGAALDAGVITPETEFDIEKGRLKIGRKVIRDSYHDDTLDVAGIMKRSSNVGTIKIARRLGKDGLHAALLRLGFGAKTEIEFPGERAGVIHPTKTWGDIGLATVSYGYGMMATPLQVAAGYAAIGNGGLYNAPRLIREIRDHTGRVRHEHKLDPRRVLKESTAQALLPMLAGVFDKGRSGGTARSVTVDGFRAGGKTGTAYKVDPKTKKYADDLYMSSFAGLAPIEAPRIAVVVIIDEPHGEEHYGSEVAGPAWAQVVSETLKYLGVPSTEEPVPVDEPSEKSGRSKNKQPDDQPPVDDGDATASDLVPVPPPFDPRTQIMIPDFRGDSIRRALDRSREIALQVSIEGTGVVVNQSPLPGPAEKGSECHLIFADR